MPYEKLRYSFKPKEIRILFVGESRPAGETFFYNQNSNLFKYTKHAFEDVFCTSFNCHTFKDLNCWLYDVCENPVNSLSKPERREEIDNGIPNLLENIKNEQPQRIVVVKKSDMYRKLVKPLENEGYIENKNAFWLPFPAMSWQNKYAHQLAILLKKFKDEGVLDNPSSDKEGKLIDLFNEH